jgi:hypothetical protein
LPWTISAACLILGTFWLRREAATFRRVWQNLSAEIRR